eukprot:13469331-Heterocapsa_arctica.AAC.2
MYKVSPKYELSKKERVTVNMSDIVEEAPWARSTQEAKVLEKDSQKDYETVMGDAALKRAMNAKSITEKEDVKASTEGSLEQEKDKKTPLD